MTRRVLLLAAVLIACWAAPSSAEYVPGPTAAVSPASTTAGGTLTVSGQNCDPAGTSVSVTYQGSVLGTATSGADHAWSTQVTVPAGLADGSHSLTVTCGAEVMGVAITVSSSPGPVPTAAVVGAVEGTTSPLPVTGDSSGELVVAAAILIAAGSVLMVLARTRRRRNHVTA